MPIKFLIDENLPDFFNQLLNEREYDTVSVRDICIGSNDENIVDISQKEERVIITRDMDFGELVFKYNYQPQGVILLRIFSPTKMNLEKGIVWVLNWIETKNIDLFHKFLVYDEDSIRIRSY